MDILKNAAQNLKSIGFGAAVPELRDKLMSVVGAGEIANDEEMRRIVQEELNAGRKVPGMKKGGKVKSASQRADGCAIRGKTRA
jgi:hypothetical protein